MYTKLWEIFGCLNKFDIASHYSKRKSVEIMKLLKSTSLLFALCAAIALGGVNSAQASAGGFAYLNQSRLSGDQSEQRSVSAARSISILPNDSNYIQLGTSFFAAPENQGVSLDSNLGSCIIELRGCWSEEQKMYYSIFIDQTKLQQLVSSSAFKQISYENALFTGKSSSAINTQFNSAVTYTNSSAMSKALGIISLIAAVSGIIVVAAGAPISAPIAASVVTVARLTAGTSGVLAAGITACKNLLNKCN